MFDGNAVLTQTLRGAPAPTWHVLRAKRLGPVGAFFLGAGRGLFFFAFFAIFAAVCGFFALIVAGAAGVGVAAASGGGSAPNVQVPSSIPGAGAFASAGLLLLAVPVAVVLISGGVMARRAARVRNDPLPALVLTHEGFVEYISSRKPVKSFAFADYANMRPHKQITNTVHHTQGGGQYTTTSTSVWLDLVARNGAKSRWRPRARFDDPMALAGAITYAFSQFQSVHAAYQP